MPFFDRFWGFRALAATLAAVSAIAFPLRYLALTLPLDRQLGMSTNTDMLAAAGGATALAAIALVLARGAALASARVEWRRDIIDGHGATRRGVGAGHRTHASRHSSNPMVLIWHISVFDRAFAAFSLLPGIPALILTVLLFAAVVVDLSVGNAHSFRTLHPAISAILVFLPCGALTSWMFWSWALQGLGKSLRISVDAEGINLRPRWGSERRIRWEDMRLLEISTYWQPEGRTLEKRECYRLYSRDSAIRWPDDYASGATYIQQAQLLDMIEARTGLLPCDLSQRWLPLPAWRHVPRREAELDLASEGGRQSDVADPLASRRQQDGVLSLPAGKVAPVGTRRAQVLVGMGGAVLQQAIHLMARDIPVDRVEIWALHRLLRYCSAPPRGAVSAVGAWRRLLHRQTFRGNQLPRPVAQGKDGP